MIGESSLWFPRMCAVCGKELIPGENTLCVHCLFHLPKTYHWQLYLNPLLTSFHALSHLTGAVAFLYFREASPYRKLLHRFKYGGMCEVGLYMGELFGKELCEEWGMPTGLTPPGTGKERHPVLVPIPMSGRKRRKRGYNQAEWLAAGLSASTGWPVDVTAVCRVKEKTSQTVYDKEQRQENMKNAFQAKTLSYSDVLLVDDVVTTGATMESCAHALWKKNPDLKLGFLSLAFVE
ncbi:MAG: phosphoribosyltransferase family protein [Bacteroidales bacterium]|jgi:ComF family protein|nr:phosphoribosyltransferase family protein [Bacteroidales bacterium]